MSESQRPLPPPSTPSASAFAAAVGGVALLAAMDAVMKGLVLAIGAYPTLLWRSFIGLAISGAMYCASRPARPSGAALRLHVGRGVLTTVMGFLFFWGIARVPLAQAIALAFIAPLAALFLASWWLGEQVGRRVILASLVAFSGVCVILAGQGLSPMASGALVGSAAILASALLYAINIILMRRQSLAARPLEIAFYQTISVCVTLSVAWPVMGGGVPASVQWPALTLAALLSTAGLLVLGWAYRRGEASFLAASEYSGFVWAAILGWWVFGETLSPWTIAGAALIIAGCIAASRPPGDHVPGVEGGS